MRLHMFVYTRCHCQFAICLNLCHLIIVPAQQFCTFAWVVDLHKNRLSQNPSKSALALLRIKKPNCFWANCVCAVSNEEVKRCTVRFIKIPTNRYCVCKHNNLRLHNKPILLNETTLMPLHVTFWLLLAKRYSCWWRALKEKKIFSTDNMSCDSYQRIILR